MTLDFYFDTSVLGPEYVDGHRHLVLSVSAALAGTATEPAAQSLEEALLQPWRWEALECALYRKRDGRWERVSDTTEDLSPVELDTADLPTKGELATLHAKLEALYANCAGETSDQHHRYSLRESDAVDSEAPDAPNAQHWPDLLAAVGRWPGLLPYRLNLQYMFKLPRDLIEEGVMYALVPTRLSVEGLGAIVAIGAPMKPKTAAPLSATDQGDASIAYKRESDNAPNPNPIASASIGGRMPPAADQAKKDSALLDMHSLWARRDDSDVWGTQDWFAALPALVAEVCDQPDGLFDALLQVASNADHAKALEAHYADALKRDALLAHAQEAWLSRYGNVARQAADGAHPLTSILVALPDDQFAADGWSGVLDTFLEPTLSLKQLNDAIDAHNSALDAQGAALLPLTDGGNTGRDSLQARSGLDCVREAARTYAWLSSEDGLYATHRPAWFAAIKQFAQDTTKRDAVTKWLGTWLASEDARQFPLGGMLRNAWCTAKPPVPTLPGLPAPQPPLLAVVDHLHTKSLVSREQVVEALQNLDDEPVLPNLPLRDYLRDSGLSAHAVLAQPLRDALRAHVAALCRAHLYGNRREEIAISPGYPADFGDPWPLDEVHDLLFPIDRPGHVDSDDAQGEDLRRQIAGIGLLVRQEGRPWRCLASASVVAEGLDALRYPALSGQPTAFAGDLRTTMVAYRGEPWFERSQDEALAIGYEGLSDSGSHLLDVRLQPHDDVRFPDLKFGQRYACAPFLIGPGNALPKALCAPSTGSVEIHPARPAPALFTTEGLADDAVASTAIFNASHYLRRVPMGAPMLAPSDAGSLFSRTPQVQPLAHEVLERKMRSEQSLNNDSERKESKEKQKRDAAAMSLPLTLLCPNEGGWTGSKEQMFKLQPPEVDMMVWLRHWRGRIAAEPQAAKDGDWSAQLQDALAVWMEAADLAAAAGSAGALPKFHDPAHDGYRIHVEQLWRPNPDQPAETGSVHTSKTIAVSGAADRPGGETAAIDVRIASGDGALSVTVDASGIQISGLHAGRVYRLSVQALSRKTRFVEYGAGAPAPEAQVGRPFAPPEIFGALSTVQHAGEDYVAFAERALLAEVATKNMPKQKAFDKAFTSAFDGRVLSVAADFHKAMQPSAAIDVADGVRDWPYIGSFVLERQQWVWGGRHVPAETVDALIPRGGSDAPDISHEQLGDWAPFEAWAFPDGSADDAVREFAASSASDPRTVIWRQDLQSRRQAEYHRFRLRARSRYAGLMSDGVEAKSGIVSSDWRRHVLKFRPGDAPLTRPKIAMLLPLTGGYDLQAADGERRDGALHRLACLVQLEEAAFGQAGLPERLHVEVAMAGLDPILSGVIPDKAPPLTVVVEGPLGHSFDPDVGGAFFRRASYIASFDRSDGQSAAVEDAWVMARLSLQREVPRDWVWPRPKPPGEKPPGEKPPGEKPPGNPPSGEGQGDVGPLRSEPVDAGWIQLPRPSDQVFVADSAATGVDAKGRPISASALRLLRKGNAVVVVRKDNAQPVKLVREDRFDGMFAVLTARRTDARGLPGGEQLLSLVDAAIGREGRLELALPGAAELDNAAPGTLRLRLLTVQNNRREVAGQPVECTSLSDLFKPAATPSDNADARPKIVDARFRLMRVSQPIEEA